MCGRATLFAAYSIDTPLGGKMHIIANIAYKARTHFPSEKAAVYAREISVELHNVAHKDDWARACGAN